jgi:peptidoglycan hydrolase CwlO-like protein
MKKISLAAALSLVTASGCMSTAPTSPAPATEIQALRAQIQTLQNENAQLNLKLQDEVERGTIQVFLIRQEISAARREAAALRTKCGAPCAEPAASTP